MGQKLTSLSRLYKWTNLPIGLCASSSKLSSTKPRPQWGEAGAKLQIVLKSIAKTNIGGQSSLSAEALVCVDSPGSLRTTFGSRPKAK